MTTFVLLLAALQLPPGPLDAFRTNYASIKAEMDFKFTGGAFKDKKKLWEGQIPPYVESHIQDKDLTLVGHWACDGAAEYFRFGSPGEILERASKDELNKEAGQVFFKILFIPKTEALWDGELLVGHLNHPHYMNRGDNPDWRVVNVNVISDESTTYLAAGRGPFHWGPIFPQVLKAYGEAAPSRRQALRWGNPTEVEIYHKEQLEWPGWQRMEISYDSAIGYLPRFVRTLAYNSAVDQASCDEMYLIEARPCAAGGFVPLEWYTISFDVSNFKSRFPNYDEATDIAPPSTEVFATTHFQASNFRDFSTPVALTEIKDVHSIAAIGGMVKRPASDSSLTLTGVKHLLGKRITAPAQRMMLNIDQAELHELDHPTSSWRPYLVGLLLLVVAISTVLSLRRRWSKATLTILL